jgi:D-cysteine desulfhydrase
LLTDRLPRVTLGHLPTPLEPLTRLAPELGGPDLWIKRDDQTGLATGGNKTRKLEFLLAEAIDQGKETGRPVRVFTAGAAQSNHARQTAAAAARLGARCTLVLRGPAPTHTQGNLLLDRILGADVVWSRDHRVLERMEQAAQEAQAAGECAYVIPYGGSNPVGASGYVAAMEETLRQCEEMSVTFDWIVFASSSGGTQAGLVVGAREMGFHGHILGISVDLAAHALRDRVAKLATATARHLGLQASFRSDQIEVNDAYLGGGYGVMGHLERDAIRTLARTEGILIDPVYTGRAFGGLLDLINWGEIGSDARVLFWHTGGTPALFAYSEELAPAQRPVGQMSLFSSAA